MIHIHTTQSMIHKIKSFAKKRRKEKGIQLSKAMEEIEETGYDNYHHAIVCFKNTKLAINNNSDALSEEG